MRQRRLAITLRFIASWLRFRSALTYWFFNFDFEKNRETSLKNQVHFIIPI